MHTTNHKSLYINTYRILFCMYKEDETDFQAIIRKNGNSFVITIPKEVATQLEIGLNCGVSVHLRKWKK